MEKTIEVLMQLIAIMLLIIVLIAVCIMGWFAITVLYHTIKWELVPEMTDQTVPEVRKKSNSFRHRFLAGLGKQGETSSRKKNAFSGDDKDPTEEMVEYV